MYLCVYVWRQCIHVLVHLTSPARSSLMCGCGPVWMWVGVLGEGGAKVHDGYECNGKNRMLGMFLWDIYL